MLITDDELFELTGYKSAQKQVKWLLDRGWVYQLNRVGRPKVDREYYRSKMGNQTAEAVAVEPNWAAI
jgi:hypothetical protein